MNNFEKINTAINIMKVVALILIPVVMLGGSFIYKRYPSLKQDNKTEELLEDIVEKYAGIYIDISPESKEV